jgi:hypothetical protein
MADPVTTATYRDAAVVGTSFVKRQREVVLKIGMSSWTRQQMIDDLHCGNFAAAIKLSRAAAHATVRSLADAAVRLPFDTLAQRRGVGVTTVYVFMCALAADGHDPLDWLDYSVKPVTVNTALQQVRSAQRAAKKTSKKVANGA